VPKYGLFSGDLFLVRSVWWAVLIAIGGLPAAQAQQPASSELSRPAGLTIAPKLQLHDRLNDNDLSAFTVADKMETDEDGRIILTGSAEVRRNDAVVKGDYIDYDRATGQTRVRGNGLIMREGSIVRGSSLDFNVDKDSGEINDPNFWLGGTGG